uniref:50S ribosomal protein L9 n=1 Tax=Arundo donax TaxID=35708 RepID=A0A0A9FDG6_ARUDO
MSSVSMTWRYFLTLPWATMTSDGARRDAVRRRSASGREEEEKAEELQATVEAHDGNAIALASLLFELRCCECRPLSLARFLIHFAIGFGGGALFLGLGLQNGPRTSVWASVALLGLLYFRR